MEKTNKPSVLLVGIGGYGQTYLEQLDRGEARWEDITVAGVADPFADRSPYAAFFAERGIPIYSTVEDFYRENAADLAIISSPIQLHRPQSAAALTAGSHVLCEKPLAPCLGDLDALAEAEKTSGRRLAVGFQWSFSQTMTALKADWLSGALGKPILLKTMVSWPRAREYYEGSTWKGRIRDGAGNLINDSITSNATAHYLHNIFFVTGSAPGLSSAPPEWKTELYRAKEIQSHDTCFLKGRLDCGGEFLFAASHAVTTNQSPRFCYEFENATVTLNDRPETSDGIVRARFADGSVKEYGNPFTFAEEGRKLTAMLDFVSNGGDIPCGIETVRPHAAICEALMMRVVKTFPKELLSDTGSGMFMPSLYGDLVRCYTEFALPNELGMGWSR